MHRTAREWMKHFLGEIEDVASWFGARYKVLDVGSYRGGAYRRMVERMGWEYTGLDLSPGTNVDVVAGTPYHYQFEDESFDVVISGSTMEHVQDLKRWVYELARLIRPAGYLVILTVNEWPEHKHPHDCWRILPDGLRFLFVATQMLHDFDVGTEGRDTYGWARKLVDWQTIKGRDITTQERYWLRHYPKGVLDWCTRGTGEKPTIVNIGVRYGASMYCLRAGCPQARLVGVDTHMERAWIGPQLDEHGRLVLLKGDSRVCHTQVDYPVHFLFIDGDHHYDVIKADIANWTPKVIKGGTVAFHDYSPKAGAVKALPHLADVKRAVDEWVEAERPKWLPASVPTTDCSIAAWTRMLT